VPAAVQPAFFRYGGVDCADAPRLVGGYCASAGRESETQPEAGRDDAKTDPLPLDYASCHAACCYSARSAFTGLIEAARCAGMMLAKKAQTLSARTDPTRTSGSHPFTWYNCAENQARRRDRNRNADQKSEKICQKRPAQHETDHIQAICSKRHAHANFACTPLNGISSHAIEAPPPPDERENAKQPVMRRHGARWSKLESTCSCSSAWRAVSGSGLHR